MQRYIGGADHPPPGEEMRSNQDAGAVENHATSKVIAITEGKQRITSVRNKKVNHQETSRKGGQLSENGWQRKDGHWHIH
jgi:hypothetical protein